MPPPGPHPFGGHPSPRRWTRRKLLVFAALLATACTDHVLEPVPGTSRRPVPAGASAFVSPVSGSALSSSALFVPADNAVRYGVVPWTYVGAGFGDAQWVEIRTTGEVTRTINWATMYVEGRYYCSGPDGWPAHGEGSSGGAGFGSGLRTTATLAESAPAEDDYGSVMLDAPGGQLRRLFKVWPGARLYARRSGISGVCSGSPWYKLTGDPKLEVHKVVPVQVQPHTTEFLPGEVLTWTTHLYEGVTRLRWSFEGTDGVVTYTGCWQETCEFAPPGPGRMKVRGEWALADLPVPVDGSSPQVTIRQPKLQVKCAPARLPQGNETRCVASVDLAVSTFAVQSWGYSGTAAPAAPAGDVKEWTFKPGEVGTGTVTVTALVGSGTQTATAQVEIVCNFFREPTGDPYLDDAAVQDLLHKLWRDTNADGPANAKKERGAYIMERAGMRSGLEYTGPADRCTVDPGTVRVNFAEVKGTVHTHPDMSGPVPTDGSCHGITSSGNRFGDGPSTASDVPNAEHLNQQLGRQIPNFVVDRRHVHRYGPGVDAKRFNRNGSCVR